MTHYLTITPQKPAVKTYARIYLDCSGSMTGDPRFRELVEELLDLQQKVRLGLKGFTAYRVFDVKTARDAMDSGGTGINHVLADLVLWSGRGTGLVITDDIPGLKNSVTSGDLNRWAFGDGIYAGRLHFRSLDEVATELLPAESKEGDEASQNLIDTADPFIEALLRYDEVFGKPGAVALAEAIIKICKALPNGWSSCQS